MRILALVLAFLPLVAHARGVERITVSATAGQSPETWHGQAAVRALNVELATSLSPRTEVAVVFAPMSFDQPRSWFGEQFGDGNETVRALSASVLARRRFNTGSSRLHFYGEASTGPIWGERPIPAATSRFNFVTQFGAGVVLLPQARFPIVAGYRFLHISNGGYSPRNPGLNISSAVVGVQWRR